MMYVPQKVVNISGHETMLSTLDMEYANRVLTLCGEITEEKAAVLNASLRCLGRESTEDIVLYIQSPGGSVSAGLSIYDTIRALNCDVVTVACGMTASMAAFLAAAAGTKGKRHVHPNAEVLIHQPLGGMQGQATDIRIHAAHILSIRERINRILAQATGQSAEQIEQDTERDNIMSAEEAVAYGLADVIGDPVTDA